MSESANQLFGGDSISDEENDQKAKIQVPAVEKKLGQIDTTVSDKHSLAKHGQGKMDMETQT